MFHHEVVMPLYDNVESEIRTQSQYVADRLAGEPRRNAPTLDQYRKPPVVEKKANVLDDFGFDPNDLFRDENDNSSNKMAPPANYYTGDYAEDTHSVLSTSAASGSVNAHLPSSSSAPASKHVHVPDMLSDDLLGQLEGLLGPSPTSASGRASAGFGGSSIASSMNNEFDFNPPSSSSSVGASAGNRDFVVGNANSDGVSSRSGAMIVEGDNFGGIILGKQNGNTATVGGKFNPSSFTMKSTMQQSDLLGTMSQQQASSHRGNGNGNNNTNFQQDFHSSTSSVGSIPDPRSSSFGAGQGSIAMSVASGGSAGNSSVNAFSGHAVIGNVALTGSSHLAGGGGLVHPATFGNSYSSTSQGTAGGANSFAPVGQPVQQQQQQPSRFGRLAQFGMGMLTSGTSSAQPASGSFSLGFGKRA